MEYVAIQCHSASNVVLVFVCDVEKQLDLVTNQNTRRLLTSFRFPFKNFANLSIGSSYISFLSAAQANSVISSCAMLTGTTEETFVMDQSADLFTKNN